LQATFYSITGIGVLFIYIAITFYEEIVDIRSVYFIEAGIALCVIVLIAQSQLRKIHDRHSS
jgi:hypothetical protein